MARKRSRNSNDDTPIAKKPKREININRTQILTETLKGFNPKPQKDIKDVYELLQEYLKLIQFLGKIIIETKDKTLIKHLSETIIEIGKIIIEKYDEPIFELFSLPKNLLLLSIKQRDKIITEIIDVISEHIKLYKGKKSKLLLDEDNSILASYFIKTGDIIEEAHTKEYNKIFNKIYPKIDNLKSHNSDSTVKEAYSDLADHFYTIIDFYIELGRFTGESKYYTYSAIFCQNALKLIEIHSLDNMQKFHEKYFKIKKLALENIGITIFTPQDMGIDIDKLELDNNTDSLIDKVYFNQLKDDLKKF